MNTRLPHLLFSTHSCEAQTVKLLNPCWLHDFYYDCNSDYSFILPWEHPGRKNLWTWHYSVHRQYWLTIAKIILTGVYLWNKLHSQSYGCGPQILRENSLFTHQFLWDFVHRGRHNSHMWKCHEPSRPNTWSLVNLHKDSVVART